MTITYELGNSLYINITNRCSNDCKFCVRNISDNVNGRDNLWLDREPTVDEIIKNITTRDLSKYDEIVFCGFGEPMIRWEDVFKVAEYIKNVEDVHPLVPKKIPIVRLNTNGHGNLIANRDITPELNEKIDIVSISLNAKSATEYDEICKSEYGEKAYNALLDFAKLASKYVHVILTVVDVMNKDDITACRKIAENLNVEFRVREII